jgi:hypothetical protein
MQTLDPLPEDKFGVFVENDADHRKLLWLLKKIGEKKLRMSSEKYALKNDGALIFVSTLLKWHQLKVPSAVYAEKYIPIYCVYILLLRHHPILKLGFTGRWPNRAFDYLKTGVYEANLVQDASELFDLDKSIAFNTDSKKMALLLEKLAKTKFVKFNTQPPSGLGLNSYSGYTTREWFSQQIYDELIDHFSSCDATYSDGGFGRTSQTFRVALDFYKEISCLG